MCGIGTSESFLGDQEILHSAIFFQAPNQVAEFLQVPPKSSFTKLVVSTRLWQYARMSNTLKAPDGLKNSKCKKGQRRILPPIPYVTEMDIVMSKEEPQVLKVRLPDDSHLNMPIYSRGITEEYLTLIVAVLRIIKQKRLDAKCRKLGQAVNEAVQDIEIIPRSRWVQGHCLVGC
jgi:hypothetical protein